MMETKRGLLLTLVISALAAILSFSAHAQTKLRIATEGTNPPFSSIDANGTLSGFDVDIARALCDQMKADCELTARDWDGIIPGLLAKKYDAVIASLNITEDRKRVIAFTNPYYRSPSVFVVRKGFDVKDVSSRALTGKPIGVQTATNHAAYLEDVYSRSIVRLYNTIADAYRDLAAGRVDYVLYDKLAASLFLQTSEGACCEIAPTELNDPAYFGAGMGIALRKNETELADKFNAALAAILADGTYQKINAQYFPFPVF